MPLEAGTKLGPYEVTAPIGAGGMGEVYRARDTKLKRDVALKILPREFVDQPERLARFQREAEVLASLNHPNIAHIYGLEEGAGATALVLELVEGPTLAERIAEGAIPIDDALDIAQQITRALEAAHTLGIIHRDLKPANVKITPEGVVKVLDFGLARVAEAASSSAGEGASLSPTLTKGTAMGVILGTAAYMSPEQAKGKPVDTRTDVWAFGAVLYEMLTGERGFQGEDVSDTLVSVFRDEPDWSKLPGDVPASVRQAMRVCLQKDAKERVRDITAVRLAMQGAFETESRLIAAATERSPKRTVTAALLALGVLAGFVIGAMSYRTPMDSKVVRASIVLPELQSRTGTSRRSVAVSPAGTHIAYVADRQLYVRALDELESAPVRGTEGTNPVLPFFSPDGQWIGFYSARDRVLAKVPLAGGASVTLCADALPRGASWSADGTIIYGSRRGIVRVSSDGGEPEVIIASEAINSQPQLLPDGRSVLFTGYRNIQDAGQIFVQSLDTGERRLLVDGGKEARYVPTGHLVYGVGRDLVAVPFDPDRLELTGGPVPLVEDVSQAEEWGSNHDIARDGTLVYVPGRRQNLPRTLVWVDREGREEPVGAEPRDYTRARISPDGTKAVLERGDEGVDLWLWDFARKTSTRLTVDASADYHAAWSPDGKHVVFSSGRGGTENMYRKAVDGTGVVEQLLESDTRHIPFAFTPDGATLLFQEITYEGQPFSFWTLELGNEMTAQPLLDTGFVVDEAALSRDGRWLAYTSDVSGEYEIYVRPFPDVDSSRWPISSEGGRYPVWGPDGSELFFGTLDGALMRVAIDTAPTFQAGNPETVLEAGSYFVTPLNRAFDISPDGTRFLMLKQDTAAATDDPYARVDQIIVVHNWFEELKTRVPVD